MSYQLGTAKVWDGTQWVDAVGGGVAYASISSTTGSPSVSSGVVIGDSTYDIYTFNGSGSVTFGEAGYMDILAVGGGGGGGSYLPSIVAGAGGLVYHPWLVDAATYTITVGGGGGGSYFGGSPGGWSGMGTVVRVGGGDASLINDRNGNRARSAGTGAGGQASGNAVSNNLIGASGAGAGGTLFAGSNSAGRPINITGSNVTYATASGGAPAANTGNSASSSNSGASGRVIVRVKV